ncbi:MAG: ribose-phosphate pyrophosphokinase, partial [Pyrinomonadaceae bacterium]
MSVTGNIKIFSGNAHPALAKEICSHLSCDLGKASTERFSDGEFNYQIGENVRGSDVFIVQPTCPPTDQNLMELLIMMDAFVRASAERVTAVIPYFGYARSDKKDRPRVPISAKLVSNLIVKAGAERILTIDLHASQIQGFFDVPVDHLYAAPIVVDYFNGNPIENLIVVAPDTGGAERARAYAKRLKAGLALCDKRRERANEADVMNIVGDVTGKNCLIVDDMCDTGGTICKVAKALHEAGAN